ncbi:MAG: hypothetical protein KAR00_03445 [Candidatus Pacebacteria bacterium]|nr:hypothetical protein [Candidatus Paceibacterota bacterium]
MEDVNQQPKPKKKMTKADWIGMVGGLFIASIIFSVGSFGFIPAFIIAMISFWVVKKIALTFTKENQTETSSANTENQKLPEQEIAQISETKPAENKDSKKNWIWIGAGIVVLLAVIGAFSSTEVSNTPVDEPTTLQAEQVSIPSFVKYSNTEAGFDFSVLFPTSDPESFDLDLGEVYIKSFQAPHIIDLEQSKFAQYSVFFSTPSGGKILSDESIRAYLENYPKGKSISSGGTLTREEITTYKGLMAIEYVFSSEMQGVSMTHKGIAFVVDGIPIDLSVVYTNITSLSNIFYDDYIKSFAISAN